MNIRVQQCDDSENYAEASVLPIVYPTVDNAYFASGKISKAASGTGHEITFTKISEAKVGDEVYIIVAHTQLKGEPLEIQVLQGEQEVLVPKDQPIKIQHQGKEVTKISVNGDHLDPDPDGNPFTNATNYCDQTIVKITLGPKASKDLSTWNDKIAGCNDVAELYLKVDAHTANSVSPACFQYNGLKGFGAEADVANRFLNQPGGWFGLKKKDCYCSRDMTEQEVKDLVGKKTLFAHLKCPLPANFKNYKELTKQLNATFKNYNIDTCLKKAHFLAQIEAESDHFNTTVEYADGWDYDHSTYKNGYTKYELYLSDKIKYKSENTTANKNAHKKYKKRIHLGHNTKGDGPKYKGRGLIQITWKSNYEKYFKHLGNSAWISYPKR